MERLLIPNDNELEVRWLSTMDLVSLQEEPHDYAQLDRYVAKLRDHSDEHLDPPIVSMDPILGKWVVLNGRHRWVAHIITGRWRIRCLVLMPPNDPSSYRSEEECAMLNGCVHIEVRGPATVAKLLNSNYRFIEHEGIMRVCLPIHVNPRGPAKDPMRDAIHDGPELR